jgi:hypothetical protein
MPLTTAMIQPRMSLSSMLRRAVRDAGTFLRDVERRSRTRPGMFVRGESRRVHLLMYADFRSVNADRKERLQQRAMEAGLW